MSSINFKLCSHYLVNHVAEFLKNKIDSLMTQSTILIKISLIIHHYWNEVDLIEPVKVIAFSNHASSADACYSKKAICIFKHP